MAEDEKRSRQQEAEYLLFQFNDQVKAIDEPTLRIFLRLRYATLLWSGKVGGASEKAEAATAAAIDDFAANKTDLLPLYRNVFHRDLLALVYLHCPLLAKKYASFVDDTHSSYDIAYSMLSANDGSGPAVKLMERSLSNGEGLGIESIFFLTKLEKEQPALVTQLLSTVLNTVTTQPGNHLLENLGWLQSFYLKPDGPTDLKLRFLSLVVEVTSNIQLISDQQQTSYAYDLLSQTLPEIERLLPSRYPQAQGQLMYLTAVTSKDKTAVDGVRERIQKSEDPLQQTISEAHSAQNKALRDELLTQAAQMALDKGKLQLAMDLAKEASDEKAIQTWRDEFFSDLAAKAIKENKPAFAEKVSLEISEPLRRATVLQDIALFYRRGSDLSRSKQILFDSLKQIELAENGSLKAVAFLRTATVFKEVDQSMTLSLVQSAMDVTDRFLFDREADRDVRIGFTLDKTNTVAVAWHLIPVVQSLVRTDEDTMLGWINSVHNHGMKASALFGASAAMFELAQQKPAIPRASSSRQKKL